MVSGDKDPFLIDLVSNSSSDEDILLASSSKSTPCRDENIPSLNDFEFDTENTTLVSSSSSSSHAIYSLVYSSSPS